MVNVNTQLSSSMEPPFGEYPLFVYPLCLMEAEKRGGGGGNTRKLAAEVFLFFCVVRLFLLQLFFFFFALKYWWVAANPRCKYIRHMCLAFSHGWNPGGVSETHRSLKMWTTGELDMVVQRWWNVDEHKTQGQGLNLFRARDANHLHPSRLFSLGRLLRTLFHWKQVLLLHSLLSAGEGLSCPAVSINSVICMSWWDVEMQINAFS